MQLPEGKKGEMIEAQRDYESNKSKPNAFLLCFKLLIQKNTQKVFEVMGDYTTIMRVNYIYRKDTKTSLV